MSSNPKITVEVLVNAPLEQVWKCWTEPAHITQWNFAIDDWHCPSATNDVQVGGHYSWRMEAKDGSFGFDFGGVYDSVETHAALRSTLGDNRTVEVLFSENNGQTKVVETFEIENENSADMQRGGWQAILDNFKKHCESH